MRRQYAGGAKPTTLTANLGGSTSDLSITGTDFSNYPDGSVGPFYVVIDRGQVSEEKILCASRSGNVITVYNTGLTNGRGNDGTSVVAHSAGSTIEHVFTATDADESNSHVNNSTTAHGLTIANVVTTTGTQTLSNKTISQSQITSLTTDLGNKYNVYPAQDVQSGTTYTFDLDNAKELVIASSSSAKTFTVPPQSSVTWLDNTQLQILNTGSGLLTIAAGSGVTINGAPLVLVQNRGGSLVRTASNVWTFIPFSGGADKAVVSSSTAASVTNVTVGGLPAKVYKFTSTGSITLLAAGLVDVICQGPGGLGSFGGGGAGGFVQKNNVYVPSGSNDVVVGLGFDSNLSQGNPNSSYFAGIVATGGGDSSQYGDRQPSKGACGGGSSGIITLARGDLFQGLIAVSTGITRGGNGAASNGGGGGGINGDASGSTGGAGYDPGVEWGSPGTLGRGGGGASMTANTGNGGNPSNIGMSGLVLVRVYD
jgi:hypothetical protein